MSKNPYTQGSNYHAIFAHVQENKGIVTKPQMLAFAMTLKDKEGNALTETAASASVAVIMGPRKESKRGDCRGHSSAEGHLYYFQPCKVEKAPEGVSKRDNRKNRKYRLFWRNPVLEAKYRNGPDGKPIQPKRTEKAEKPVKAVKSVKAKKGKTAKVKPTVNPEPAPVASPEAVTA